MHFCGKKMTDMLVLVILSTLCYPSQSAITSSLGAVVEEPEFTDVIQNITVAAGRNIRFACAVKNLQMYKVAWMHFEQSAILAVNTHVITRNPRISVTHDKHRTWFLHINNVQEEDKGRYMCQINTVIAKTQFGFLYVVVPPNINDSMSSSDAIVREGSNETLTCKATGFPTPSVKWKRDDNTKITINKTLQVSEWEGETLELTKISRLDMGAFLCIASNGVPPTVSKRIKVSVNFPPMLWIPHQLVGAPLNYAVTLECFSEANPSSLNYWTREDGQNMIHDSRKYRTENSQGNPSYKTHMKLTINNIQQSDYGTYKCVAKNPRGETDGTIRLYPSSSPTSSSSVPTTILSKSSSIWIKGNGSDHGRSLSIFHISEKGSKYQSTLNEIDISEQKPSAKMEFNGNARVNYSENIGDRLKICSRTFLSSLLWIFVVSLMIR
ncbi:neurotrimin-like [Diabrotica virgifera virgifera]|uniref:Ig-like domain-containing protein n=1 Tax=Diabrotica virgifera virgifera TaxID=50390 RepID=A0ABM5LAS9_DIAVI|nr:neurotrimin-like [Diabrotica virgifera virgifera]